MMDSEAYLLTCMRYIEMNPVRAGMTQHPGDYRWSSYAANASGQPDELIQSHPLYRLLGELETDRQYSYRELFRSHMDVAELHDVQEALNQELVLGREDFKDKIESMINRQARPGNPGRPRVEAVNGDYYLL